SRDLFPIRTIVNGTILPHGIPVSFAYVSASTAVYTLSLHDALPISWTAVDGVLIIGTSDEVKGLDLSSGDQLWAVSAPTDGFAVTGSQLRIQHEGAVSSFDFTDSADDQSVTADKGFDESISALPAPKLPSEDDIRNATLE